MKKGKRPSVVPKFESQEQTELFVQTTAYAQQLDGAAPASGQKLGTSNDLVLKARIETLKALAFDFIDTLGEQDFVDGGGLETRIQLEQYKKLTRKRNAYQTDDDSNHFSNYHEITDMISRQEDPTETGTVVEEASTNEIVQRIRDQIGAGEVHQKVDKKYVTSGTGEFRVERRSPILAAYRKAMKEQEERIAARTSGDSKEADETPTVAGFLLHDKERRAEIQEIIDRADHPLKLAPTIWALCDKLRDDQMNLLRAKLHIDNLTFKFRYVWNELLALKELLRGGHAADIKRMREDMEALDAERWWLYNKLKIFEIRALHSTSREERIQIELQEQRDAEYQRLRQQVMNQKLQMAVYKRKDRKVREKFEMYERNIMAVCDRQSAIESELGELHAKYVRKFENPEEDRDDHIRQAAELERTLTVRRHYISKNAVVLRVALERLKKDRNHFVSEVQKGSGVTKASQEVFHSFSALLEDAHESVVQALQDMFSSVVEDMSPFIDSDLGQRWAQKDDPAVAIVSKSMDMPNPYALYVATAEVLKGNFESFKKVFITVGKRMFDNIVQTLKDAETAKERECELLDKQNDLSQKLEEREIQLMEIKGQLARETERTKQRQREQYEEKVVLQDRIQKLEQELKGSRESADGHAASVEAREAALLEEQSRLLVEKGELEELLRSAGISTKDDVVKMQRKQDDLRDENDELRDKIRSQQRVLQHLREAVESAKGQQKSDVASLTTILNAAGPLEGLSQTPPTKDFRPPDNMSVGAASLEELQPGKASFGALDPDERAVLEDRISELEERIAYLQRGAYFDRQQETSAEAPIKSASDIEARRRPSRGSISPSPDGFVGEVGSFRKDYKQTPVDVPVDALMDALQKENSTLREQLAQLRGTPKHGSSLHAIEESDRRSSTSAQPSRGTTPAVPQGGGKSPQATTTTPQTLAVTSPDSLQSGRRQSPISIDVALSLHEEGGTPQVTGKDGLTATPHEHAGAQDKKAPAQRAKKEKAPTVSPSATDSSKRSVKPKEAAQEQKSRKVAGRDGPAEIDEAVKRTATSNKSGVDAHPVADREGPTSHRAAPMTEMRSVEVQVCWGEVPCCVVMSQPAPIVGSSTDAHQPRLPPESAAHLPLRDAATTPVSWGTPLINMVPKSAYKDAKEEAAVNHSQDGARAALTGMPPVVSLTPNTSASTNTRGPVVSTSVSHPLSTSTAETDAVDALGNDPPPQDRYDHHESESRSSRSAKRPLAIEVFSERQKNIAATANDNAPGVTTDNGLEETSISSTPLQVPVDVEVSVLPERTISISSPSSATSNGMVRPKSSGISKTSKNVAVNTLHPDIVEKETQTIFGHAMASQSLLRDEKRPSLTGGSSKGPPRKVAIKGGVYDTASLLLPSGLHAPDHQSPFAKELENKNVQTDLSFARPQGANTPSTPGLVGPSLIVDMETNENQSDQEWEKLNETKEERPGPMSSGADHPIEEKRTPAKQVLSPAVAHLQELPSVIRADPPPPLSAAQRRTPPKTRNSTPERTQKIPPRRSSAPIVLSNDRGDYNYSVEYADLSVKVIELHGTLKRLFTHLISVQGLPMAYEEPVCSSGVYNAIRSHRRCGSAASAPSTPESDPLLTVALLGEFAQRIMSLDRNISSRVQEAMKEKIARREAADFEEMCSRPRLRSSSPQRNGNSPRTPLAQVGTSTSTLDDTRPPGSGLIMHRSSLVDMMRKAKEGVVCSPKSLLAATSPQERAQGSSTGHRLPRHKVPVDNGSLPASSPGERSASRGIGRPPSSPEITESRPTESTLRTTPLTRVSTASGNQRFSSSIGNAPQLRPVTATAVLHPAERSTVARPASRGR